MLLSPPSQLCLRALCEPWAGRLHAGKPRLIQLSTEGPLDGVEGPAAACGDISAMTSPPSSPRPQAPPQADLQLAFRGFSPGCLGFELGRISPSEKTRFAWESQAKVSLGKGNAREPPYGVVPGSQLVAEMWDY